MIRRLLTTVALIAALATSTLAQLQEDDLLLGSSGTKRGVYALDWESGKLRTINAGLYIYGIAMSHGNYYGYASYGGRMYRFSPTSSVMSTLANFPSGSSYLRGMAVDQDGAHIVSSYGSSRIYRLSGSAVRTLSTISRPFAVCRDFGTGHFVVGTYESAGKVISVDRISGRQTTLASGAYLGNVTGIAYLPSNKGYFAVARYASTNGLVILKPDGSTHKIVNVPYLYDLKFCQKRNRIFAANYNGIIYEFTPDGVLVKSRNFGNTFRWRSIGIFGRHNVSPSTAGARGDQVYTYLRFNQSKKKTFCVAVSLGMAQTLKIGSRHQHISLDPLFFATACGRLPFFTTNFTGTTSSLGTSYARFTIPRGATYGMTLYITASAVNSSYPGSIDFGNTAVIRVR